MSNFLNFLVKNIRLLFSSRKGFTILSALAVLILILVLFKACGSNSISNSYYIGRESRWSNINLMGKERNLAVFADQLLTKIAEEEELNFIMSVIPPVNPFKYLENQELDGVITALKHTPQHEQKFIFSDPFFLFGPVLVVPVNSPVNTWEETKYKILGVGRQSSVFELGQDPSIRLRLYDNMLNALIDLDNHRIDGAVMPAMEAYIYTNTFYPGQLKVATSPLTKEGLRLVALKNKRGENLIKQFNEGLAKIRKNKEFEHLIKRWDLVDPEKIDESSSKAPEPA